MCQAVLLSSRKQAGMLATSAFMASVVSALAADEQSQVLSYVPMAWVQVRWCCWCAVVAAACRVARAWGRCDVCSLRLAGCGFHNAFTTPINTTLVPAPLLLQAPLQLLDVLHGPLSPFAASAAPVPAQQMHTFISFVVRCLGNTRILHPGEKEAGAAAPPQVLHVIGHELAWRPQGRLARGMPGCSQAAIPG
jgi:hypothetical protein